MRITALAIVFSATLFACALPTQARVVQIQYGDIDGGHVSSALCHLGNVSHQLGHTRPPQEVGERIKANALFSEAYDRMREHLARNHVDLGQTPPTLGMPLAVDAARERFTGPDAEAANALLRRDYRAPYVVPQLA